MNVIPMVIVSILLVLTTVNVVLATLAMVKHVLVRKYNVIYLHIR